MSAVRPLVRSVILICLTAACGDLSTPQELSHPQILAVKATPPVIPAGERSQLTILIAGPDGRLTPPVVRWTATTTGIDGPVIGAIETDDSGSWFVAPEDTDGQIVAAVVQADIALDDSTTLRAIKVIGVGAPVATANPTISDLFVDGAALDLSKAARVETGSTVTLTVSVTPAPGPDATYAWYANLGELAQYRSNSVEFTAPPEPDQGSLFAVYRDGAGGVDWQSLALVVE